MGAHHTTEARVNPMFTKRLFLASPVEHVMVRNQLLQVRSRLAEAFPHEEFAWEEHPHITLRFLGSADLADEEVRNQLKSLHSDLKHIIGRADPFPLTLGHVGVFPGVIYCSVSGDMDDLDRLNKLAGCVDRACSFRGFPSSEYPFKVHITVGRFDRHLMPRIDAAID